VVIAVMSVAPWWVVLAGVALLVFFVFMSVTLIGPTEVGLVAKRTGRKLGQGHVIAFNGEAGYQEKLLMPGLRFRPWLVFSVKKHPWVQVPADGIGVVIAQVGQPLPAGAKSAHYREEFGNFRDVRAFVEGGGQQGVQRPVLPPGSLVPIHPVGFLVLTYPRTYGVPVSPDILPPEAREGNLTYESFGLQQDELKVVRIEPQGEFDFIGVVTTQEGDPLPSGDIAGRLGGFADAAEMEEAGRPDGDIIEILLGSKNHLHNNYQNFQAFLDNGGKIGLQHDPLLYGSFLLNPFLLNVERVPMLVVNQGEVAVIKSYLGLSTQDTSGVQFKFGSIVRPGHRGIWRDPLRTGKYALNPRVYRAEVVPTAILTLNWAEAVSHAHQLDAHLRSIDARSREGFMFTIDLQVQIHVPDTKAPSVISMVGTMLNLVNEVLQSAVGNYFRNTLQGLPAVEFIETRQEVQDKAERYITEYLGKYEVETKEDPRDRRAATADLRARAGGRDRADRHGEGTWHGRRAGRPREGPGERRHPEESCGGSNRRGRGRVVVPAPDGPGPGRSDEGDRACARQGRGGERARPGRRLRRAGEGVGFGPDGDRCRYPGRVRGQRQGRPRRAGHGRRR
jgi:uncharacterized membrane protein YqiK